MRVEQVFVLVLVIARSLRAASSPTRQLGRLNVRPVGEGEQMAQVNTREMPVGPPEPTRDTQSRLDKRSWTPRASRPSQEMVDLLLEELASLDIEGGKSRPESARQAQQQQQQQFVQDQPAPNNLLFNGRLRGRSASGATGSGQQNIISKEEGVASSSSSFPLQQGGATTSQLAPGNYPKRRNSNRHMPCFFNAITCF